MKSLPFAILTSGVLAILVACESDPSGPSGPTLNLGSTVLDASLPQPAPLDASTPDALVPAVVQADVTADFSIAHNPNGAWTYGYTKDDPTSPGATLVVFSTPMSSTTTGIPSWYDPANAVLNAPAAWRNDSGSVNTSIAAGEFALHPGNAGEYAIARWTAPAAGTYAVMIQFKTGDVGDTNGLLLKNGVALVTEDSTSTDAVHELDVTLAAGDHLDAAVGSKGDFRYDSTPVHLTIRSR